jgi:hypothetical protein
MFLRRNNLLMSAALVALVSVGAAASANAMPATWVSQAQPEEQTEPENQPEMALPDGLTEVKATVVRVTNDNAVRVRMPDGGYEIISLARSTRLTSLDRGDDIYVTMRGQEIVGVSSEAGAYQQVATSRSSSSTSSQTTRQESVQTETQVQPPQPRPQVVQQPAPAPAPAPAPEPAARPQEPVRALW